MILDEDSLAEVEVRIADLPTSSAEEKAEWCRARGIDPDTFRRMAKLNAKAVAEYAGELSLEQCLEVAVRLGFTLGIETEQLRREREIAH